MAQKFNLNCFENSISFALFSFNLFFIFYTCFHVVYTHTHIAILVLGTEKKNDAKCLKKGNC